MPETYVSDFYYDLPKELIAQFPADRRDISRLLVLDKKSGDIGHGHFYQILEYLDEGDLLILNNSKVIPARLYGLKEGTGGKVEILLNNQNKNGSWEVVGKGLKTGVNILFNNGNLVGTVLDKFDSTYNIKFNLFGDEFFNEIEKIGKIPLPPYIKRTEEQKNEKTEEQDKERYQTVYAKEKGSVAAPTAGLHFTQELLKNIERKGVGIDYVTLHVGIGTFAPIKTNKISDHKMHKEYYSISRKLIDKIIETKKRGGRIIAVGTTSTRVLETVFGNEILNIKCQISNERLDDSAIGDKLVDNNKKTFATSSGETDIFIYPPYKFRCVDAMITNFHLPQSTLLMLISAFAGKEKITEAYEEAIKNNYRFFSYGDAMLIK